MSTTLSLKAVSPDLRPRTSPMISWQARIPSEKRWWCKLSSAISWMLPSKSGRSSVSRLAQMRQKCPPAGLGVLQRGQGGSPFAASGGSLLRSNSTRSTVLRRTMRGRASLR